MEKVHRGGGVRNELKSEERGQLLLKVGWGERKGCAGEKGY